MLEPLNNYDWEEVFKYAEGGYISPAIGDDIVNTNGFVREDVVAILHYEDGENDCSNWEMIGFLRDGRWFFISAGCDYTGWG